MHGAAVAKVAIALCGLDEEARAHHLGLQPQVRCGPPGAPPAALLDKMKSI